MTMHDSTIQNTTQDSIAQNTLMKTPLDLAIEEAIVFIKTIPLRENRRIWTPESVFQILKIWEGVKDYITETSFANKVGLSPYGMKRWVASRKSKVEEAAPNTKLIPPIVQERQTTVEKKESGKIVSETKFTSSFQPLDKIFVHDITSTGDIVLKQVTWNYEEVIHGSNRHKELVRKIRIWTPQNTQHDSDDYTPKNVSQSVIHKIDDKGTIIIKHIEHKYTTFKFGTNEHRLLIEKMKIYKEKSTE